MLDLEILTNKVRTAAMQTGSFLQKERRDFDPERVEEKNLHDYVSYVDREAERILVEMLREILPEAGFIAEEGSASYANEEYCWVIDPLDGTTNFIHNNAPFCVSIALRNREEILLGVVYEVCRSELFWAWKGGSAFCNNDILHVSDVDKIDAAFIALGLPYAVDKYKPFALKLMDELYGTVGGIRIKGAAAVEMCYLAAGRFDARIEAFLGPWDVAAGIIILQQAGGKVSDFSGGDDFYSGRQLLASNGKLHKQLLEIVSRCE